MSTPSAMRIYALAFSSQHERIQKVRPDGSVIVFHTDTIFLSWTDLQNRRHSEIITPEMARREIAIPCPPFRDQWTLIRL